MFTADGLIKFTSISASLIHNDISVSCEAGIRSVSITTGIHDHYHRCSDTADRLNYKEKVEISEMIGKAL